MSFWEDMVSFQEEIISSEEEIISSEEDRVSSEEAMHVIGGDDLVIPAAVRVITEDDVSCGVKRVTIGMGSRVFRRA